MGKIIGISLLVAVFGSVLWRLFRKAKSDPFMPSKGGGGNGPQPK